MSADIGPGDFVEAIRSTSRGTIIAGRLYRVEEVARYVAYCTPGDHLGDGLLLQGVRGAAGFAPSFCACGFRPILRPKPDAFADLLKAPDHQRVTA